MLEGQGKKLEADKCYKQLLAFTTIDVEDLLQMGEALLKQKNVIQADKFFTTATQINPKGVGLYNKVTTLLMDEGHYKQANKYIDKAIQLNPKNEEILCNKGIGVA